MKGKISFREEKKEFVLVMEGGKEKLLKRRTFPDLVSIGDTPRECDYELLNNSKVETITLEGKVYHNQDSSKKDKKNHDKQETGMSAVSPVSELPPRPPYPGSMKKKTRASAPYNFIPLNDEVVAFAEPPPLDRYFEENEYLSGYIDIKAKTLTPLYVRGANRDESNFFAPSGIPRIPGSTIRGMTRSLLEIVTYGTFLQYDKKTRVYYRSVAEKGGRNKAYLAVMKKAKAGFLFYDKHNRSFAIKAAPLNGKDNFKKEKFNFSDSEYTIVEDKAGKGLYLMSGDMEGKKHKYHILYANEGASTITLDAEDVNLYQNDAARGDMAWALVRNNNTIKLGTEDTPFVSLLDMAKKAELFPNGVPCFFLKHVIDGENRILFGHTRNFRIPYNSTVGKHVPEKLQDETITDAAQAIFGKLSRWSGRVFFEDAVLESGQQDVYLGETVPGILLSPKISTYQHYLEQNGQANQTWDTTAPIRGYKLYWHRNTGSEEGERRYYNWKGFALPSGKTGEKVRTIINPVKPEVRFRGRIRFDNLSAVELGALLFVLDLPKDCCHKLGMGKSLGLGSLAIKTELRMVSRCERAKRLFDDKGWDTCERLADISTYLNDFERQMFKKLDGGNNRYINMWEVPRLAMLKAMLTWKEGQMDSLKWLEETRPLEIELIRKGEKDNEYTDRLVLPNPAEVIKVLN